MVKVPEAFDLTRKISDFDSFNSIRDGMYKDCVDWFEQTSEPIKLGFLSMRYSKRARKLGVTLLELVSTDERFSYRRNRRGAFLIAPYKEAQAIFGEDLTNFWLSQGVPL